MIQYRPDIDGLRAVAVSLVILFHAGLPYITGGFVGVDIFFVISGYLITSVIIADLKVQKFTFARFYERRIRRILPVFYLVSTVTIIGALCIHTPSDLTDSSSALLAALFFSSNFYFWRTTNYFSDASDFQPFLHTWSLGVEEQFYFFFPVALVLLFPRYKWLIGMTLCALALSLMLSIYATSNYEWAGYYLLPSRAWQMIAGAMLAIRPIRLSKNSKLILPLSTACLCCLFLPPFLIDKSTPFPGVAAVPSTIGACLAIVLGSSNNLISKALGSKIPVAIGLISYSLYLWHWPIFSLMRYYKADTKLLLSESVGGIMATFLLAYLSWKFIENPLRDRKRFGTPSIYRLIGISSIVLVVALFSILYLDGIPSRLDEKVIRYSTINGDQVLQDPCNQKTLEQIKIGDVCHVGSVNKSPSIILWGDSHAASFKPGYSGLLSQLNLSGYFLGKVGCPPLPGIDKVNFGNGRECLEHNNAALEFIKHNQEIRMVILHSRWALSVEGSRYGAEPGKNYILKDSYAANITSNTNLAHVSSALDRLIDELIENDKKVIIVGPVPEVGVPVPRFVSNQLQWNKTDKINPSTEEFLVRQSSSLALITEVTERFDSVNAIYPHLLFCDDSECRITDETGELLYLDDDHVSELGARYIANQLRVLLQEPSTRH